MRQYLYYQLFFIVLVWIPAIHSLDLMSDTWTATDGLGRSLPRKAKLPRQDRFVGVFYFLWLGLETSDGPFDISKIITANPDAMQQPNNTAWGPLYHYHHWGEPYFGYYRSTDQWVIRRHARMLANAGVDVIFFDVTNTAVYLESFQALCQAFSDVRAQGGTTPQVAFLTPFGAPLQTVETLFDNIYKAHYYSELWFIWEGKPLILSNPQFFQQRPDILNFFTFRTPQPDYFIGPTGPNQWGWLEVFPQHIFRSTSNTSEQMTVGVGQNAVGNRLGSMSETGSRGRSFHNNTIPSGNTLTPYGLNVQEQWERVLQIDPQFVFVTGWNEWIALRLSEFASIKLPVMFVDEFDWEHSRDMEPCAGGTDGGFPEGNNYQDAYYYQLISNIRRYKGARAIPTPTAPTTIIIGPDFKQWETVGPSYIDYTNDVEHRNEVGYNTSFRYKDDTGRNDIALVKVARDTDNVYFYARTNRTLTNAKNSSNWMLLFINIDRNFETGWEGFDIVINRHINGSLTSVERSEMGWNWQLISQVSFVAMGNELHLAVPRILLGFNTTVPIKIDFKWVDNMIQDGDILSLIQNGDTAPDGRFSYIFDG
ncbi:unnamed protein product [Adineta steineri]|uniref:Uncharacterized protein n=2 Tax=Adineta steineri TaxID=433720 RepID=A0A814IUR4_9BILA|nr:unnamed protein product [Adineta steineri]CAF1043980.1 unnamed protein product [Adineta steineri]CAF3741572.1 unnamed protein product [Adineta steineri]